MLNRIGAGLTYSVGSGVANAAGAAACSAAGAGILAAAHHANYHAAPQAASGAVGGAIMSGGLGLITGLAVPEAVWSRLTGDTSTVLPVPIHIAANLVTATLSGLVGAAILRDAGHSNIPTSGQAAAASAVGVAVISGGALALTALLSCVCARPRASISAV